MIIRSQINRDPFASSLLVALIVHALRRTDPALVDPEIQIPDELAGASVPAGTKTGLLEFAYLRGGVLPILGIGSAIGVYRDAPVLETLLRSSDTDVLAHKWARLEQYHHSDHRVEIDTATPACWRCTRPGTSSPPGDAENLLICGLMAGLLRLFGCHDLNIQIAGVSVGEVSTDAPVRRISAPTNHWVLQWRDRRTNTSEPLSEPGKSITDRLHDLLGTDPGQVWTLAQVARELNLPPRSMQRELRQDGHSFSTIVRSVRTREAARRLRDTEQKLADIGYCCGYSDQAHFQRDFRRATNMTPNEYRRTAIDS